MVLLQVKCHACKLSPHRPLWLLRQLWKTIQLLWQVSLTPLNLLPNVVMNGRSQDLLGESLQQEKAARDVLAGNVQPVCETLYRGFAGRGLPQWHCRADLQAWLLQYVVQTVDSALSMLVLLPLLKIKAGNYFEVKGSLCFQGKVSLKIIVMLRLSLVKDLLYIQGREISNPYKQILLGA